MKFKKVVGLVALASLLLVPRGASAQSATTGAIAGVVRDATGAVLPGVTGRRWTGPSLNGIWQALNAANWDIQDHSAQPGPAQFGVLFAAPAGSGEVAETEI